MLARFVHQEYLQVAAETGLLGLGWWWSGWPRWPRARCTGGAARRRKPTAALAVLAAFGVHSAFDFLWHIPVLPLLAVLAVLALVPINRSTLEEENPMNRTWKTGAQVALVLLAGGAMMLSGGVAMAMPSAARHAAHAECSVVQLPGMDVQLGEPGACVSMLMPSDSVAQPDHAAADQPGRRHDRIGAGRRREPAGTGRGRQYPGTGRRCGPPRTGRGREPALALPGPATARRPAVHRRREPAGAVREPARQRLTAPRRIR